MLVQRSTLELLLNLFPIHSSQLTPSDTVTVLTAAISVVLRRDMSLNRRLYAWLVGTDANGVPINVVVSVASSSSETGSMDRQDSGPNMLYFEKYSKTFLVQAVKRSLGSDTENDHKVPPKLRPFRILISLLDKPEVGSAILEDIFLDVLCCIHRECVTKVGDSCVSHKSTDNTTAISEVIKTANLLLGSLEPSFIWHFISDALEAACAGVKTSKSQPTSDTVSLLELCTVVDFMLDKLSLVRNSH